MPDRWRATGVRGADYDRRFDSLAAAGADVHGEASLVSSLLSSGPSSGPGRSVLDAGCGTGRVAIELARRGLSVVGVDLDPSMLSVARTKAPSLTWVDGDLATVSVPGRFDAVVMAGNVMIFVAPGSEAQVVANMARHLVVGGLLIAGFSLRQGLAGLSLEEYDRFAVSAGLGFVDRWATWDRAPYAGGDYAVSVHRLNP